MKKAIVLLVVSMLTMSIYAQHPNMHIKARIGSHLLTYVDKKEVVTKENFAGINGGFGFRVMYKKQMLEIDFDFLRSYINLSSEADSISGPTEFEVKLNSFELPITMGYITINKPVFKHFLYGGIATRFTIKSFFTPQNIANGEPIKVAPKEFGFTNPAFLMRLGTQFDVAMFNFDFNYSLGLNKAFRTTTRTQTHQVQFNLGLVF